MSLAWPWMLLALPLPWFVRRWLPPVPAGAALRVPALDAFGAPPAAGSEAARAGVELRVALFIWLLLVAAAARPQVGDGLAQLPVSGRDLVLALDVSASMAIADLRLEGEPVGRLHAARALAQDFLARREGDRVGLVVFGSRAYLHTPLTYDLGAVRAALAGAEVGLAGRETAIGDAIALAATRLREHRDSARVLVLVTDGASTAGALSPRQAAWLAQREGLRIHAVGVGAEHESASSEAAQPTGLDEDTLREIARQTGGSYHRATDVTALEDFYRRIDALEPTASAVAALRPVRELFHWPLGLALVLTAGLLMRRLRRVGR